MDDSVAGIKQITNKNKRLAIEARGKKQRGTKIKDYPFFRAIKPKEKYAFFSDYFMIDKEYATILTVLHDQGADDRLSYFWGINLIPRNLPQNVSVRKMEHVARMTENWVAQHQTKAEGLAQTSENDVARDGTLQAKAKLSRKKQDLAVIANELMAGSSYLRVAMRLLVKAPSLNELDDAVAKINRQYKDGFDTVFAAAYMGEQRSELSNLFTKVEHKLGRNFMFTSREYSGNYNLVTHGIEDAGGEYVGLMWGDVNNSAVLFDIDNYDHHVVLAGDNKGRTYSGLNLKGQRGIDVWAAKLGMTALMNNRRVVHLVLNGAKIPDIGVDLTDITSVINMDRGDINMFEMFGDKEDELAVFPAQLNKLVLMAQQSYNSTETDKSIIDNSLRDILTTYYIDSGMWVRNAQENRDLIRAVGIPHNQVPRLPQFISYLDMGYERLVKMKTRDENVLKAYSTLRLVFKNMLETNGDLFNTTTSNVIDRAKTGQRVVYDFSRLIRRGKGVAMAQFVNALGFAVGSLQSGDLVVLHGVDQLVGSVKDYVKDQFDILNDNGVRTAYVYGTVERMVKDKAFNEFEKADYTILGGMSESMVAQYEASLNQEVSVELRKLMVHREPTRYYLRRGFDNIIFTMDLQLGIDEQEDGEDV